MSSNKLTSLTPSDIYRTNQNRKVAKKNEMEDETTSDVWYHGRANSQWLKKHKLTITSKPSAWYAALQPQKPNASSHASLVTTSEWTSFTKKAKLTNAGVVEGFTVIGSLSLIRKFRRFQSQSITTDKNETCHQNVTSAQHSMQKYYSCLTSSSVHHMFFEQITCATV